MKIISLLFILLLYEYSIQLNKQLPSHHNLVYQIKNFYVVSMIIYLIEIYIYDLIFPILLILNNYANYFFIFYFGFIYKKHSIVFYKYII